MEKRYHEQSIRYLEEGNLTAAENLLTEFILKYPENHEAHHLMAVLNLNTEDNEAAYHYICNALDAKPNCAMYLNTLGNIEFNRGYIEDAEEAFLQATICEPEHVEYRYNLANFYLGIGEYQTACEQYEHILRIIPEHYLAKRGLMLCHYFKNDLKTALTQTKEWSEDFSQHDEPYYYMGLCYYQLGEYKSALSAYDKALLVNPTNKDAICSIGLTHRKQGNFQLAINFLRRALSIDTNNPHALYNLGSCYFELGDHDTASEYFNKAHLLDTTYPDPICGFGCLALANKDFNLAIKYFQDAIECYDDFIEAKLLLATTYLQQQEFSVGFKLYEERLRLPSIIHQLPSFMKTIPKWQFNKLRDSEHLLVWCEQGLGDQIMFMQLLTKLQKDCKCITLLTDGRLVSTIQSSFPEVNVVAKITQDQHEDFAYQIPLISLAKHYIKQHSNFNGKTFLSAEPTLITKQMLKMDELFGDKILIGISWHTNNMDTGHLRNISLNNILNFVAEINSDSIPNNDCQLINLQFDSNNLPDFIYTPDFDLKNDLNQLSALIANLDQVITIDNTTAHLAGALGIKTHVLVPPRNDWRWGIEQKKSYWYESVYIERYTEDMDKTK